MPEKTVENGIEETLAYYDFPYEHWMYIRTNNLTERVNREIRRRTNVVGSFPDGHSVLMQGLRKADAHSRHQLGEKEEYAPAAQAAARRASFKRTWIA